MLFRGDIREKERGRGRLGKLNERHKERKTEKERGIDQTFREIWWELSGV